MMKRITALALALTMLLSLSTAFAWSCPSCGHEMSGKFCTECGTKKPENTCPSCGMDFGDAAPKFCTECGQKLGTAAATAAPTATPAPEEEESSCIFFQHEGTVYVIWEADGTTEYTIHYFPKQHDDVQQDMTEANWAFARSGKNTLGMFGCSGMVPGEPYWVGVFDGEGNGEYVAYIPQEKVETFTGCTVETRVMPTIRSDSKDVYMESFADAMLATEKEGVNGLYMSLIYDNPGEAIDVRLQAVLECPNGYKYVLAAADTTLKAETMNGVGWPFHDLAGDLAKFRTAFGGVPVGEYTVSMYINGQYGASATFEVRELSILDIEEVVLTGDGRAEMSWSGGEAPYKVTYCQRMSDDAAADVLAASEAGVLYVHEAALENTTTTLNKLVPDTEYWIVLTDAEDSTRYVEVDMPIQNFEDFETQLIASSSPVDVNTAVPAVNYEDGLYLGFVYDNPGEPRTVYLQCVVDYGNGYRKVTETGELKLASGRNCLELGEFASLDAMLETLTKDISLELGEEIVLGVCLDGKVAGVVALPVEQEEEGVLIDSANHNGDGTLTLSWHGGVAPYKIYGVIKKSDDFFADREEAMARGLYWSYLSDLQETTCTVADLIPGVDYWIVVMDAEENGRYQHILASETKDFTDFPVTLEVAPRTRTGETVSEIASIPADVAGLADDPEYGARVMLYYSNPGEARELNWKAVVQTPDGDRYVRATTVATLGAGEGRQRGWSFLSMDWDFSTQLKKKGAVPEGEWLISLYLDGDLVGTGSFTVATPQAVVITGVEDQGNGKHLITWEDSGKGPYDVHYFQRFTDDRESDRSDGRGSGWWTAEGDVAGTSAVLEHLVPGKSYWLTVTDSEGTISSVTYDVPAGGDAGYGMTVQNKPRKAVNDSYTDLETFSAAVLNQDYTDSYGLYLRLNYQELNANTSEPAQWVITLPDGVVFCEYAFDLNLFKEGNTYWDCYTLDWFFKTVKRWYGEVLQGVYRMDLYIGGDHAGATTFTVGE